MNKSKRPVNLDLTTIKFPPAAIASILHRISGVIVFLFIPFLLWVLAESLRSPESFAALKDTMASPLLKIIVWAFLSGMIYHLIAGIRHLLMDMYIGETLEGGRNGAYITFIVSVILIILAGIWLW